LPFTSYSRHWFFRYKLYHLPFWLTYHYLWWTVSIGDPVAAAENIFSIYGLKYISYVLLQAIGVYFNLYYLLPRLLERGKVFKYLGAVALTIITVAALIPWGYYVTAWISGRDFQALFNHDPADFFGEKENLATELKFLKSQFNPHFLFNTINSIFVLIHKNPDMASESLAKFSNLLRYQLYECNDAFIPLGQELAFLENFFELESLRQNSHQEVRIDLPSDLAANLTIAPFLLIPFLENAFKHVSQSPDRVNEISVRLWLDGKTLRLNVRNTKTSQTGGKEDLVAGGIGLKNVRRRLDLLYPDRHELDIREDVELYTVNLSIYLHTQPEIATRQLVDISAISSN